MVKTLVFLFDGTTNNAAEVAEYTNVYAINNIISFEKKTDEGFEPQITFYIPGVGTQFTVDNDDSWGGYISIGRQIVFGDEIEKVILRGYINLCSNYQRGDKIVILGFSRGAVAARIFARLLSDFGILRSDQLLWLNEIWAEFIRISDIESARDYYREIKNFHARLLERSNERHRSANREVFHKFGSAKFIKFLGVFDTVVGPKDKFRLAFRNQRPGDAVEHVIHLMSMHESRAYFPITRFTTANGPYRPTVREIWLPGVHADIGGGYEEKFLSLISLLTMAHFLETLGEIEIDKAALLDQIVDLRVRIRNSKIYVNSEPPPIIPTKYRSLDFQDEIHPIHFHLARNRIKINWKADKEASEYIDRYMEVQPVEQDDLKAILYQWLESVDSTAQSGSSDSIKPVSFNTVSS